MNNNNQTPDENSCSKIGTRVFFTISNRTGYSFSFGWNTNVATFPIGFRPKTTIRFNAMITREANVMGDFEINTDGSCRLFTPDATNDQALFVSGSFETV